MRFLVLLAGIATSYPALAEENMVGVLTATIDAQVERVATANDIYETVCYASDPERTKGGLPSDACVEAGATFNYEMDRLDRLLGAKEAIVQQAAVQAQINQVNMMRSQYNDNCFELTDEDRARLASSMSNTLPKCEIAKEAYDRDVEQLVHLIHGEAPIVCTGDDCPDESSDGSN